LKFFLDSSVEPLSSKNFDFTEVLMQVPLSKEELKILNSDKSVSMKVPLNRVDQHNYSDDAENGTFIRNFERKSPQADCPLEVQMLFVTEGSDRVLEMGIKDTKGDCLPAALTARFPLSPISYAGDNMRDGIRMINKTHKAFPAE